MAERASMNTGRGAASHNDLTCGSLALEHVDMERSKAENLYYIYEDNEPVQLECPTSENGFYIHEIQYYNKEFSNAVERQRSIYMKKSQAKKLERCTIDNWYKDKSKGPEEQIYQYGNLQTEESMLPSAHDLFEMVNEQALWEAEYLSYRHVLNADGEYEFLLDEDGNPVRCSDTKLVLLDVGIHMGETTPHAHLRKAYLYKDKNGNWTPGNATKVFREAGIMVPYPEYDESYYDVEGNPEFKLDEEGNPKGWRKDEYVCKTVLEKTLEQITVSEKDHNGNDIVDDNGNCIIDWASTKELREKCMKRIKRVNCEKSTWDRLRRMHWIDILQSRGYSVEKEPLEPKSDVPTMVDNMINRFTNGKRGEIITSRQVDIHKFRRQKAIETIKRSEELKAAEQQFEEKARNRIQELVNESKRELYDERVEIGKERDDVAYQKGVLRELTNEINNIISAMENDELSSSVLAFARSYKLKRKDGTTASLYDLYKDVYEKWSARQEDKKRIIDEVMNKVESCLDERPSLNDDDQYHI